ncbi:MAG: exodeoxyribonuclease VII large subunit [Bacteroidales bacterium]|nr:exodeoxyribonuclease VII large subunit [Bacteroidales bacterium]
MQQDIQPISLLQLNGLIKRALESSLERFYLVKAEIQSINCARNGHAYLELIEKAENGVQVLSQARATIWSSQFRIIKPYFETTTGVAMQSGIKILVKASVSFHEIYGLSLNITDILPEYTIGEMAMERQKIIARLKSDGVFDMNHDLQLPRLIQRIAVISSAGAAGYGDFVNQLKNNAFGFTFRTTLFEAAMQGNTAEASIVEQLENISQQLNLFDCVVIIRGGGSKTDLQCFDNYNLCQNICQFPLPVITGIGPAMQRANAINDKINRITNILRNIFPAKTTRLESVKQRISAKFALVSQRKASRVDSTFANIRNLLNARIREAANDIRTKELLIEAKNPLTILKKGYTYTTVNGHAITSANQLSDGDEIVTVFSDGQVKSKVTK